MTTLVTRVKSFAETVQEEGRSRLFRYRLVRAVAKTVKNLGAHDATHMAAGVAYYALLSIFPLFLALIAIFSFFFDEQEARQRVIEFINDNIPAGSNLIEQNIEGIIRLRGAIGFFGAIGLIWGGSALFGAVSRAVNRAWGIRENRPFYISKPRHIVMALSVGVLMLASIVLTAVIQMLTRVEAPLLGDVGLVTRLVANFGGRIVSLILAILVFALVYRLVPIAPTSWKLVWPGAVLAGTLFEAGKTFFVLYLDQFANYEAIYGSLASVIILLFWFYLSAFFLILGAEFTTAWASSRQEKSSSEPVSEADLVMAQEV